MPLHRYAFPDSYTGQELRRLYNHLDVQGRLQLLSELKSNIGYLPDILKQLAIDDGDPNIRQWIARHGGYLGDAGEVLRRDPDELVRAGYYENAEQHMGIIVGNQWREMFVTASHIERLAIVRNSWVDDDLIEEIFDFDKQKFGLSLTERKELVLAFLTNEKRIQRTHELDTKYHEEVFTWYPANEHSKTLWELISRWPDGSGNLQHAVYKYVGANDETKALTYKNCDHAVWRRAILENCTTGDKQTLELASKDDDETARDMADEITKKVKGDPSSSLEDLLGNNNSPSIDQTVIAIGRRLITIQNQIYGLAKESTSWGTPIVLMLVALIFMHTCSKQ